MSQTEQYDSSERLPDLISDIGPYTSLRYSCARVLGNIGAPLGFGDAMDSIFDDVTSTSDVDGEEPQRVLDIATVSRDLSSLLL